MWMPLHRGKRENQRDTQLECRLTTSPTIAQPTGERVEPTRRSHPILLERLAEFRRDCFHGGMTSVDGGEQDGSRTFGGR